MDLNAIAEYLPLFGEAALLTVKLGFLGIIFSIIIGLICAVVQYYKVPVIRRIVSVYIEISRNTPLLVQLFSSITDCLKSAYRPTPKPAVSQDLPSSEEATWRRLSGADLNR